jgi:hypothetical protein
MITACPKETLSFTASLYYLLGAGLSKITNNTSVGVEKVITGHTLEKVGINENCCLH